MSASPGYLLLVEDDPDILRLLSTTLKFRGHRVITACNGKEGLDAIRQERPAIVIADIMMPKLDGFGLVHRLRINPETRTIPVIFITATFLSPEDKEFALDIGVTRFIQKPLDMDKFLETLDKLLKQGDAATLEPLEEFSFYEGYRTRLETKLAQKTKQIARDQALLGTRANEDDFLQASLRHDLREREELKLLLDQVYGYLAKFPKHE
ncbi:MAG TPA: response regulator [Anaerolineales bacterium]|nr:response regulator [Anaerolineales bacterium]